MKVYTTFILSASITRGVTYAKLTHTVAEGRYTTAPYLFPNACLPTYGEFLDLPTCVGARLSCGGRRKRSLKES